MVRDLKEQHNVLRELVVLDGVVFLSLLEKIPVRTKLLRLMFQNVFEKAKNRVFELHFEDGDHQNMQKRKRERRLLPVSVHSFFSSQTFAVHF